MKKITIGFLLLAVLSTVIFITYKVGGPTNLQDSEVSIEQPVFRKTHDLSREYVLLRYQTDEVLVSAKSYASYESWNQAVIRLIGRWEYLAAEADILAEQATSLGEFSFDLTPRAQAYSKQEISDIFDKAPAGKKIKTLATFLGVDAKKAFQILKQDQAQVEADAWNEAGDTFQKLETSAVILKDAAKVTGFVGTIALTGGTAAIASGSVLGQAAVVVSGADLVLEVTDDAAKIALGNKNKISTIVGDIRVVTEPAASIMMITDLPKNLTKGIEKLNVVTFGLDQFNSSAQEGKVIGIKLPVYTGEEKKQTATASVVEKTELESWISDNSDQVTTTEDFDSILTELGYADEKETANDTDYETIDGASEGIGPTEKIAGEWVGTITYTSYTPSPATQGDQMWCQTSEGLPITVPLNIKVTDYGEEIYNAVINLEGGANCDVYPDGWDNFSSVWKKNPSSESNIASGGQLVLSGKSVSMKLPAGNSFTGQIESGGQTMSGEAALISTNGIMDIGVTTFDWSVSRQ